MYDDYDFERRAFGNFKKGTVCGKCKHMVGRLFASGYDAYCTKLGISLMDENNPKIAQRHNAINLIECDAFEAK